MARDHAKEYARKKELAKQRGFNTVREARAVAKHSRYYRRSEKYSVADIAEAKTFARKTEKMRMESKRWSAKHSRIVESKYDLSMSDEQIFDYYDAFLKSYPNSKEKKRAIHEYLEKWYRGDKNSSWRNNPYPPIR